MKWSDEPNRNEQVRDFFEALAEHDNLATLQLAVSNKATGEQKWEGIVAIAAPKEIADSLVQLMGTLLAAVNRGAWKERPDDDTATSANQDVS